MAGKRVGSDGRWKEKARLGGNGIQAEGQEMEGLLQGRLAEGQNIDLLEGSETG